MRRTLWTSLFCLQLSILTAGALCAPKSPAVQKKPAPAKSKAPSSSDLLRLPLKPYVPQSLEAPLPPRVELPLPPGWPTDIAAPQPLSADEAARLALYYQGNITIAQHQLDAARGVTRQAQAPLGPNISLSANYSDNLYSQSPNRTSSAASTGSAGIISGGVSVSNPYTVSASLRQLIFDFNHTRDLVHQNQELENAAAFNYTQIQYDAAYNVKIGYYNWLQAERLTEVFTNNLEAQRQHLEVARGRYAQGVGLASDITRSQTSVSEAVLNVTQSQVNATVARTNLANAMGIDPRIPLVAGDSHESTVATDHPEKLFDLALQQRPEFGAAEAFIRANEAALRAAHTNNAPALTATLQYVGFGPEFYPAGTSVNFLVGISWNPFDGGFTIGKIRQSQANLEVARAQLEVNRNRILTEVSQAYVNYQAALVRIETVKAELASALETASIAGGRYKAGVGLFIDVVDSQAAALTAKVNQVNAQLMLEQARLTLNHALGVPLSESERRPPQVKFPVTPAKPQTPANVTE